jgi:hypothetical protein
MHALQAVLREGARLLVTPAPLTSLDQALLPEVQAQWRDWAEPAGAAANDLAVPTYQQHQPCQGSQEAAAHTGGHPTPENRMAAYVSSLPLSGSSLGPVSAVVNCSGIGARALVGDPLVRPIRGQVIRVRAPWIKSAMIAGGW